MKRLLLIRHAKSSWDDPGLADVGRPLAERGRRAGATVGAWLADRGDGPALILCSPAARTRETVALLLDALPASPSVRFDADLYDASPERLLATVRALDDGLGAVWIVGHNPGLEQVADRLIGAGPRTLRARLRAKFPTAAVADLALGVKRWREAAPGCARLEAFVRPRDLAAGSKATGGAAVRGRARRPRGPRARA